MQYAGEQASGYEMREPQSIDELGLDIVAYIEQIDLLIELTDIETQTVEAQSWEQLTEVVEAKRLLQPLVHELSGLWPQLQARIDWLESQPASYLSEDDQFERDGLDLLRSTLRDLDEALERNEAVLWRAQNANRMTLETLVRVFSSTTDSPELYTRNGIPPSPPSIVSIVGQPMNV